MSLEEIMAVVSVIALFVLVFGWALWMGPNDDVRAT